MNHISLETAKKLKEVGWQKKCLFHYKSEFGNYTLQSRFEAEPKRVKPLGGGGGGTDQIITIENSDLEAPLAEEMLEVLPEVMRAESDLGCIEKSRTGLLLSVPMNENPAEALALLLIELVEQGVVSRESLTDKK